MWPNHIYNYYIGYYANVYSRKRCFICKNYDDSRCRAICYPYCIRMMHQCRTYLFSCGTLSEIYNTIRSFMDRVCQSISP